MKGYSGLILVLSLSLFAIGTLQAGSLEKYGSPGSYKQAPKSTQSKREEQINKAVRNLREASPEHRKKMIATYKNKIQRAEKLKKYRAAAFYHEILERAGYEK